MPKKGEGMEFRTEMGTYIKVPKLKSMTWEEHIEMCRELVNAALDNEQRIRGKQTIQEPPMTV